MRPTETARVGFVVLMVLTLMAGPLTGIAGAEGSEIAINVEWTDTIRSADSGDVTNPVLDNSGNAYIGAYGPSGSYIEIYKYDKSTGSKTLLANKTNLKENTEHDNVLTITPDSERLYLSYIADTGDYNVAEIDTSDGSTLQDNTVRTDNGYSYPEIVIEAGYDSSDNEIIHTAYQDGDSIGAYEVNDLSLVQQGTAQGWNEEDLSTSGIGTSYDGKTAYVALYGGTILAFDTSPSEIWKSTPSQLDSNDNGITGGPGGNIFVASNNNELVKLNSSGNYVDNTNIGFSGGRADIVAIGPKGNVIVGDPDANLYRVQNTDITQYSPFQDTSSYTSIGTWYHIGSDSTGIYLHDWQSDGTFMRITEKTIVNSIDLELGDSTLVKPETANYAVNATYDDGTTSYITSSSNVSSDDTNVVSIDSVNTEIEYQGDGTTIVRANYTNDTGVTLWSNKTVETDTPEISLNVETNSMTLETTKNYTVTRTIFGSTSDITGVANTSSDNVSVISVNESASTYYGESIGTANLTADNTYNGLTYEDSVEVEVTEPQEILWENWDYLNSGERMSLILSDWTIIYLFAALILSTGLAVRFKAGKIGLGSMGALTLLGWILGFVPDYTALTLLIFFTFIGFAFEWRVWISR